MGQIEGIGGVFIYSNQPKQLAQWYHKYLGISWQEHSQGTYSYTFFARKLQDEEEITSITWAIFSAKEPLPEPRKAMINYRVGDLDSFVQELQEEGIEIEKQEEYDYGKFAWIKDPDGNPIELFEDRFDYHKMLQQLAAKSQPNE